MDNNGGDWGCAYCNSAVPGNVYECPNCGHPKPHVSASLPKIQEWLYLIKDKIQHPEGISAEDEVIVVDASRWNGSINYEILPTKASGVILRMALGLTRDANLTVNRGGAVKANFPYGMYHAPVIAPGQSPSAQAEVCKQIYQEMPSQIPLAIDLEKTYFSTPRETDAFCYAYASEVRSKTGIDRGLLYSRKSWWDWWILAGKSTFWQFWEAWPAHWTTASIPLVMRDWNGKYKLHQFEGDNNGKAAEYGFTGGDPDVDLSRFNGTMFEYLMWLVNVTPPPPGRIPISPLMIVQITANLNTRALPDAKSLDIGTLGIYSDVSVIEVDGDWYRIDGWINKNYTVKK